ncbi:MAG: hypothetical protein FWE69_08540, partial [Clostridiales bacterium]|nr:hypothetical protein [Clostridiales bacterium]
VAEVAKELETEGIPKDRATLAAALSGGVIGPARDYATEEYRTFRARALEGIETLLFAAPPYQGLAALLSAQAEGKKKAAVQAEPLRRFLTIFASLLRDALAEGDRINIDCAILHGKITARFTNAQIQRMIKRTLEAERHLYFNANPGFVLDWLITNVQTTMYKLQ